METAVRRKEVKVIKTTTSHSSGLIDSSENIVQNKEKTDVPYTNGHHEDDKKWQIASITESGNAIKEKSPIMNGINGEEHVKEHIIQESQIIPSIKGDKKWEIESIHSLEDDDEDNRMTTQVKVLPFTEDERVSVRSDSAIISNGKYGIESIRELPQTPQKEVFEEKWDITSINTQEERLSSKRSSIVVEDSWVEHHTIPIHSTSVQMRTQEPPRQTSVYKITPSTKGEVATKSVFVGNPQIKYPIPTSRSEIIIGSRTNGFENGVKEKPRPVDHYSYQYEDSSKTLKLRQLANSNSNHHNNVYNSFEKASQPSTSFNTNARTKQWPTTNCMRQSIHVDNDDEEILGVPLILDENNRPIENIKNTQSFNSITENVSFQIHKTSAQMKIEISVEMFHNTDRARQMWKRKKVKVTRFVELDLSKVRDKRRLEDIVDRCNVSKPQIGWSDRGLFQEGDARLSGKDAYSVFYNLMAITHEEEDEAESHESTYLTRTPSGKLTSVICEPQFLLSGIKDKENSTFFY